MLALVNECNLALTGTPLATVDENMLIISMRFPIWPYNSNIITGNKLQTTTCFVLNKPQLVVCILREFLLGCLVIKASLVLKSLLIVAGSYNGLDILLLSFGSEMFLAFQ